MKFILCIILNCCVLIMKSQTHFQKGNFIIQPSYGMKIKEYLLPSSYKRPDVEVFNSNHLGLKICAFLNNRINAGLQLDYHTMSMSNVDSIFQTYSSSINSRILEEVFDTKGEIFYYYSNPNGYAKAQILRVMTSFNFFIVKEEKIYFGVFANTGLVFQKFHSSVDKKKIQTVVNKMNYNNSYDDPIVCSIPYEVEPIQIRFGFFLGTKLSDRIGVNLETGLGYTNINLGIYYILR